MHRPARVFAVLALLCGPLPAAGQAPDGPLVTDRPDFTESSVAVPAGRLQLEGGATRSEEGGEGVLELGEWLLRIGARPGWEVRVQAPTWIAGPGEDGLGDAGLGFKAELPPAAGAELAVLAMTSIPVATGDGGVDAWQPEAILAAAWGLPAPLSLAMNLGVAVPEVDGDRRMESWLTAALGIELAPRVGAYLETYGFADDEDGLGPGFADAGLTFLVHDDFQLDARAGAGFGGAKGDWYLGVGASRRW
jgi:hypothetical protein